MKSAWAETVAPTEDCAAPPSQGVLDRCAPLDDAGA